MSKSYIITFAQNATPVHAKFLASLKNFPAQLIVIAGRYKNPTSQWAQQDQDDQWWDESVTPYLTHKKISLCKNLVLYGDVRIQPTAVRPLTGFEVYCGSNSGIFGHPKRALECVPTATRMPRILATTGACTVPNYTDSKAGKKGEAHHILGALVVEVEKDGTYHLRQVTADKSGKFTDLDKTYTPNGVQDALPALAVSLGDLHVGREDEKVLVGTGHLLRLLKPKNMFLHDVLDFGSRNHHRRAMKDVFQNKDKTVESEVKECVQAINEISKLSTDKTYIVQSNHDEAFDRWLEEAKPKEDPINAPYYHKVWSSLFEVFQKTGKWSTAFELESKRLGIKSNVKFIQRNQDIRLKGVSYGFHGDKGINGARGSSASYAKLGCKTVIGHSHTPRIIEGCYQSGVTATLDHGYNTLPSSWMNSHTVQYADGKRAIINIINGKFRAS